MASEIKDLMKGGVHLGYFQGQRLGYSGEQHLITSAPGRTEKGATVIIPTLLASFRLKTSWGVGAERRRGAKPPYFPRSFVPPPVPPRGEADVFGQSDYDNV